MVKNELWLKNLEFCPAIWQYFDLKSDQTINQYFHLFFSHFNSQLSYHFKILFFKLLVNKSHNQYLMPLQNQFTPKISVNSPYCAKLLPENMLMKLTPKKSWPTARMLNFGRFALYAVRHALKFDEIDPRRGAIYGPLRAKFQL